MEIINMKTNKNVDGTVTLTLENQQEIDGCAALFRSRTLVIAAGLPLSSDSYGLKNLSSEKTHSHYNIRLELFN